MRFETLECCRYICGLWQGKVSRQKLVLMWLTDFYKKNTSPYTACRKSTFCNFLCSLIVILLIGDLKFGPNTNAPTYVYCGRVEDDALLWGWVIFKSCIPNDPLYRNNCKNHFSKCKRNVTLSIGDLNSGWYHWMHESSRYASLKIFRALSLHGRELDT